MVVSILVLHGPRRADRPPPDWHGRLIAALPYAKRLDLERRTPDERAASLDALGLLCAGLHPSGHVAWTLRDLRYDEQGAPKLPDGLPAISLAHSTAQVACAIAPGGSAIGIDVEAALPDRLDEAGLARVARWVATEAVLKAAGHGVRDAGNVRFEGATPGGAGPAQSAVFAGRSYCVQRIDLGPDNLCCVAVPADQPFVIRIEAIDLDAASVSAAVECALGLAP